MEKLLRNSLASLAMSAVILTGSLSLAMAGEEKTQNADALKAEKMFKQCIVFYSPQYKKNRIKPIKFEFRWCDKGVENDCSKWESDTLADQGNDYSLAGRCITFAKPLTMELRYNQHLSREVMTKAVDMKPEMIALKGNLEPDAFCTSKAIHRFKIRKGRVVLRAGRPGNVNQMKCVWSETKPADKKASS